MHTSTYWHRSVMAAARLLAVPELAAVVQVAGDLDAVRLGRLAGLAADIDNIRAERRVMPVKWNQSTPSKILFQSNSAVVASRIAECARS